MQLDRSQRRQNRRGDWRRRLLPHAIQRMQLLIHVRFDAASDAHDSSDEDAASAPLLERTLDELCEHRSQLARRSRQQQDEPIPVIDPQTRRAASRVGKHFRSARHHRLPTIAFGHRHRQVSRGKARAQMRGDRFVLGEWPIEHRRHDLSRQVIVGRTKAAAHDDEIRASEPQPQHVLELGSVVADDSLCLHVDAEEVQLLGDEERVGVDLRWRQQSHCQRR